jgi:23S rRNA (guanosine2251-2'-O)-methyltransferase
MSMRKNALISGRQPVIEAIKSGRPIDRILFQRNVSGESIGEIRKLAEKNSIPIQQVPPEKLHSLTKINHQGVIAFAALIQYLDLQQVIDHVISNGNLPLFLMLDGITDTRNIGGIARSALCCGAQTIIIPDKGVGALNEDAIKSSAGALESIHVCRVHSLLKATETLHLNGFKIFCSGITATKNVFELDFTDPVCVVMGSEDNGVQRHIWKAADQYFTIPMSGKFDSFNVSVAAGIILYEAMKQRMES